MLTSLGIASDAITENGTSSPQLLVELPPWRKVFFGNLIDLVWTRKLPPLQLTSKPAPFWKDVFVPPGYREANFARSYVLHILAIMLVYSLSLAGIFGRPEPALKSPFQDTKLAYYSPEDYLPPLESPAKPAEVARKGEPKLARQEIISVPPEPDNSHQTIIAPTVTKLTHDVALPNIVMAAPVPAMQPMSASARTAALRIPQLPQQVVAPAPEVDPASRRSSLMLPTDVVAPAPDPLPSNVRTPTVRTSVVEPPPSMDEVIRRAGKMNMAALSPKVVEPKMPVPVQRATGIGDGNSQSAAAPPIPPAPSAQGLGSGRAAGQLIALSLNPSAVSGPIETPAGSRHGSFAAGPQGKPDAPGTPEIKDGGIADDGNGGSGKSHGSTEGIFVGKAPAGATISPIVGSNAPTSAQPHPDPAIREKLMAAARPPDIARQPAPGAPPLADNPVDNSVFGARRYYQLSLNMPNLNSSTGSWVIRFAELKPTRDSGDLSAPIATIKVDPAYPPDLLRDRVEGTVVLYAIIHADGSISDIRVLSSVHERLDANAIKALGHWKFTPGSKHGTAVDLEAVVRIPFHARRSQF